VKKGKKKLVLVDSGASFSILQPEIAAYLGIPITDGQRLCFHGITGKALGYPHQVPVRINQERFDCHIAFPRMWRFP
jgi:hypothetical protein